MANTMPAQAQSADESLFTTLYHSGVGWLNDILETEVFIDVSLKNLEDPPCIPSLLLSHSNSSVYIFLLLFFYTV
jgi:hypothetical protein